MKLFMLDIPKAWMAAYQPNACVERKAISNSSHEVRVRMTFTFSFLLCLGVYVVVVPLGQSAIGTITWQMGTNCY